MKATRDKGVTGCSFSFVLLALTICILPGHSFGQSSLNYDSIAIEALDPDAWNGMVFLAKAFHQPASFALRIGSRSGGFLDGEKIFDAVREVGPHAPDASYCRVAWRHYPREALVTLEWSRIDQNTVVGRLTAAKDFQLVLETYFSFLGVSGGAGGFYSVNESQHATFGERHFDSVFGPAARFVVMVDRPLLGSGIYPTLADLRETMNGSGRLVSSIAGEPTAGAAGLEFTTEGRPAHFVAILGWDNETLTGLAKGLLAPGKIDTILKEKAEAYAARRPFVTGLFEGAPEAIGNSMFWNTLYAPASGLFFPSISRHWAHDWGGWVVGEWDCFFGSLLTSLEDEAQTVAAIQAILLAQTDTGLVPNIAAASGITPDRSQPPVGSYITWKVYQRIQDRTLLEWAYPRLKKWHQWWLHDRGDGQPWRDGNHDGLLEWGSDRGAAASTGGRGFLQAAKWESGMDDSPMYDEASYDPRTYTMNLYDVGLNSLYTLDAECLQKIAAILGKDDDAKKFAGEYEHLKQLVREKLWNEPDGIYENRFWNGQFSRHLSPTNFYPLFAGIASLEQAKRMVEEHLLNKEEFWGTYVAPTIARNDPAFPDQNYWRGDIWGPTNYMLYEGITRYGFDKVALEYAQKNYDLFMNDWRGNQHDNEQYHAWGGNGGGDTHYTWGALLCLVALEQYIDKNPWEGLRFGALSPVTEGEFRGSAWEGHTYDVAIGPNRTAMSRDGKMRFQANAGVVVRQYQAGPQALSFLIKSERGARITTSEFDAGDFYLRIDRRPARKISLLQGSATFDVPAGEHTVELATQ
ncbi:MAG TPA: trehalase family glycosidase [Terriglobia bacterium]|nr:trehalase family glycosidase [Terriglobia bacterium]